MKPGSEAVLAKFTKCNPKTKVWEPLGGIHLHTQIIEQFYNKMTEKKNLP